MKFVTWMVDDSGLREEVKVRRVSLRSVLAARNTASSCLTGRAEMTCVGDTTDPDFVVTWGKAGMSQPELREGLNGTPTDPERSA